MKKILFVFFFMLSLGVAAQADLTGFDQPICSSPVSYTYTYMNYTTGSGSSALNGYKIYRNGLEVYYYPGGSMSLSESVIDMLFINDSTGFIVVNCANMATRVVRTTTYGNSWTNMSPLNIAGYKGMYVVSASLVYSVCAPNGALHPYMYIAKHSDFYPDAHFINDDSVTTDIYKTDTLYTNSLCGIDSLNIFVSNSPLDSIDYHINFFYVPDVGIDEYGSPTPHYSVYPNPACDRILISGGEFKNAEIYSSLGQKLFGSTCTTIPVGDLLPGIYFIRIMSDSGRSSSCKFIKQ
ncbi:MAG: T9SS type A sorting domain-containing protein [Bacteroidia bacterium]